MAVRRKISAGPERSIGLLRNGEWPRGTPRSTHRYELSPPRGFFFLVDCQDYSVTVVPNAAMRQSDDG
jgi:hypothetical protein